MANNSDSSLLGEAGNALTISEKRTRPFLEEQIAYWELEAYRAEYRNDAIRRAKDRDYANGKIAEYKKLLLEFDLKNGPISGLLSAGADLEKAADFLNGKTL